LVNLYIPTVLPPLILVVVLFVTWKAEANPWASVKDGQLSWAALGMLCSALYELGHPSAGVTLREAWISTNRCVLIGGVLLCGLYAVSRPPE